MPLFTNHATMNINARRVRWPEAGCELFEFGTWASPTTHPTPAANQLIPAKPFLHPLKCWRVSCALTSAPLYTLTSSSGGSARTPSCGGPGAVGVPSTSPHKSAHALQGACLHAHRTPWLRLFLPTPGPPPTSTVPIPTQTAPARGSGPVHMDVVVHHPEAAPAPRARASSFHAPPHPRTRTSLNTPRVARAAAPPSTAPLSWPGPPPPPAILTQPNRKTRRPLPAPPTPSYK
ncbi:hypothetical protein B0H14DRAFT_3607473 [Mycena olivaceomarginata]|nr:hypothetical protein B0H14DRAFT_3607473 [Mycena olivaceomarginata]